MNAENSPSSGVSTEEQAPVPPQDLLLEQQSAAPPAYSRAELRHMQVNSFRFSQGNPKLQNDIIDYAVSAGKDRIDPEVLLASQEELRPALVSFVQKPKNHNTKDPIDGEDLSQSESFVKQERSILDRVKDKFQSPDAYPDAKVHDIAQGFIGQDYRFIVQRPGGRPRRDQNGADLPDPSEGGKSTFNSRYLSHFVYYGLLGRTTNTDVYDDLYRKATADLLQHLGDNFSGPHHPTVDRSVFSGGPPEYVDKTIGEVVSDVVRTHFTHYPQDLEDLSPAVAERLGIQLPQQ